MAASEEEPEAPTEPLDVACGLENVPVGVWPPGAEPEPFQYTPDHVAGPGADTDPAEITFPGCTCLSGPCVPGTCACLRHGDNYDEDACLQGLGLAAGCAQPVFECNALCPCPGHCGNRVVQRGLQLALQVFRTADKGWGLRTLQSVPRGRFVCEYAGEVLGFSEAQRRVRLQTEHDSNYVIAVREHVSRGRVMETFVDPARLGNVGRFLNHSCEPNLLMVPVRVDSMVPRLALFAARDILPGEELSYDYSGRFPHQVGSGDEGRPEDGKPRKPCHCGSRACAAFLPYDGSLFCASAQAVHPEGEGGSRTGLSQQEREKDGLP
ncbi:histone-lysine N-methyltransferase SETMAR isoform 1-T1 [Molossus nigricans]